MARVNRKELENKGDDVKKISFTIRKAFDLKQFELALLLSTSRVTVSAWETRGVAPFSNKPTPFNTLIQFIALVRQCKEHPEFLSFEKLKAYVKVAVKGGLYKYYVQHSSLADEHFLYALKSTNLNAVFFALFFDDYLKSKGKETPENLIITGSDSKKELDYSSVDGIISIVDGLTENGDEDYEKWSEEKEEEPEEDSKEDAGEDSGEEDVKTPSKEREQKEDLSLDIMSMDYEVPDFDELMKEEENEKPRKEEEESEYGEDAKKEGEITEEAEPKPGEESEVEKTRKESEKKIPKVKKEKKQKKKKTAPAAEKKTRGRPKKKPEA